MKIEEGEIIQLDNSKEYICFSTITEGDNNYVYLISNFKPLEVKFAKQVTEDGSATLEIINNQEQKKKLLTLFTEQEKNRVNL